MDSIVSVAAPVDPVSAIAQSVTAIANAVAATMNFLSTTQGQAVVASQLAALATIQQNLTDLGHSLVGKLNPPVSLPAAH